MEKLENTLLCRFCLNVIINEKYKVIEETIEEVLNVLLLKENVNENLTLVCDVCSMKLFAAFEFKIKCMDTEDSIISHVNSEKGEPIDLIKIYLEQECKEHLRTILENEKICRLCMQIVPCEFNSVKDVEMEIFHVYVPEINFYLTKDPIICSLCLDSLFTHSNFLNDCSYQQENIKYTLHLQSEKVEVKIEHDESSGAPFRNGDELTERKVKEDVDLEPSYVKTEDPLDVDIYRYYNWEEETHSVPNLIKYTDILEAQVYTCHLCDYTTKLKYNLTRHQLKHTNTFEIQVYKSEKRNYETQQENDLTSHRLMVHLQNHKNFSEIPSYKCTSCDFQTKYEDIISFHQLKHLDLPKEEFYKCDACSYETKYKNRLATHLLTHKDISEVPMFECHKCTFRTKYKNNLSFHQLRHKDMSKMDRYKCVQCHYKTNSTAYLKRYLLHHKDVSIVKMFQCDLRDYKTKRRNNLRSHQLKHRDFSEVLTFKCDLCCFKTKRKNNLDRHQLRHNDPSDLQMYECETCGFETKHKYSLTRHEVQHKK